MILLPLLSYKLNLFLFGKRISVINSANPVECWMFSVLLSLFFLLLCNIRSLAISSMDAAKDASPKDLPLGLDASTEEEYAFQSKLLQELVSISSIDKAWTFKSNSGMTCDFLTSHFPSLFHSFPVGNYLDAKCFGAGMGSQAMFLISQANLLANKRGNYILSASISKESGSCGNFQWAPFPIEMAGVSTIVPSPSGSKLLVIRNPENESPTRFEIWSQGHVEKEFHMAQSVHGSVYTDGW